MCYTLGTGQATLTVLSQSFRSISGALVATEEDKIGLDNIPPVLVCVDTVIPIHPVFLNPKAGSKQHRKTVSMG